MENDHLEDALLYVRAARSASHDGHMVSLHLDLDRAEEEIRKALGKRTAEDARVGVKPLEWGPESGLGFHYAATPLGSYVIMPNGRPGGGVKWWFGPNQFDGVEAATLDEAKVAAQVDYETRILSALVMRANALDAAGTGERLIPSY